MARVLVLRGDVQALVAIATGLLAGAWLAGLGIRLPMAWAGCALTLVAGGLVLAGTRGAAVRPARRALPLFAGLAALVGQALAPNALPDAVYPRGVARLEGEVLQARAGRRPQGLLRVSEGTVLDGERPIPPGTRVAIDGLDEAPGARVRLVARVRPTVGFRNPSPHPDWPAGRTVAMRGRLRGDAQIVEPALAHEQLAHGSRRHLRARLEATLSPRTAGIARALLLGDQAIDEDARDRVRGAGLSHVLAVSGLHVTLIAGGALWLFLAAWRRIPWLARRGAGVGPSRAVGILVALAYAGLVADAPSAWRAALTAALAWGLEAAGRRPRPASIAAGAVILIAALRPSDLVRPGLILSVVATAAIVSGAGSVTGPEGALKAGLRVAARSTVATAPITAWLFGAVPAVGLLANVVAVPVAAALVLPAMVLHAIVACLAPPLAFLTAWPTERAVDAFLGLAELFEAVPLGRDLPPLDVPQGLVLAIGCAGLLVARRWPARVAIALAAALAIGALEHRLRVRERPIEQLRVTFLDVGQGDAALVDLPDGRLMVVDAGGAPGGGPDPGERALVPLLRARRRDRIDVFVLSHPHPDHYEGLAALLDAVPIGEIWDSGQAADEDPDGVAAGLLARARAAGTTVLGPRELCGRDRRFGRAAARVHYPCPRYDAGWGPNDNSLVVELRLGRRAVLFAGDAEAHAEGVLTGSRIGPVDVLKVPHHGSRTSSSVGLLRALRPLAAVISAGRGNRFGHPHPEVAQRLEARIPCVRRTDRDGGVRVWTDGQALTVDGCAVLRRTRKGRAPAKPARARSR